MLSCATLAYPPRPPRCCNSATSRSLNLQRCSHSRKFGFAGINSVLARVNGQRRPMGCGSLWLNDARKRECMWDGEGAEAAPEVA